MKSYNYDEIIVQDYSKVFQTYYIRSSTFYPGHLIQAHKSFKSQYPVQICTFTKIQREAFNARML